jgi:sugar phosphate isomerase/epimerase
MIRFQSHIRWIAVVILISIQSVSAQFLENIGICTKLEESANMKALGYKYLEGNISGFFAPFKSDADFQKNKSALDAAVLPMPAANGFFPGNIRLTGPDVKMDTVLAFAQKAFERAKSSNTRFFVLGSGTARKIPEGFSPDEARRQFIEICKKLGPLAKKNKVIVVIEPLNKGETNFINSVLEGMEIVKEVNHPNIRLLADIYHMMREDEGPESIEKAGRYIHHVHIAEKTNRTVPGTDGDDFRPYLRALRKVKYKGGISLECRIKDLQADAATGIKELKKQIAESAI